MTRTNAPTQLVFQRDGKLLQHKTSVVAVLSINDLSEGNRSVFKQAVPDKDFIVITKETIFHPQGGGQPTDEGHMALDGSSCNFQVTNVRMDVDASSSGQVLHLGQFLDPSQPQFKPGDVVEQVVDAEKRLLYSRLHTAGHVLGAAVRHLLEKEIEGFDELKASHFPDSAACEFQGSIDGKWKAPIQERLNEYIMRGVPVEIDFWTEDDFRREGLERLIPDRSLLAPGEDKFRVVKLAGLETYPCGGTHVDTSDLCGDTSVKKISRSKGTSRVSYSVK
ncbi:hypothetical protein AC578_4240 [Pseudocercospora eumusae]|uniref:Alanyl-transfer RNA synthetases family profile domain-containing protein n=1 Tax=Pseudocercospora eumusae TaxID=321146 RepID=A0A139GTZ7_9PEZI|nr:hypothetical protein AC578_4240 [Pseudocercospora eumusae]